MNPPKGDALAVLSDIASHPDFEALARDTEPDQFGRLPRLTLAIIKALDAAAALNEEREPEDGQ